MDIGFYKNYFYCTIDSPETEKEEKMKIPPIIRECKPIRFVKSLYYANRPIPKYQGYPKLLPKTEPKNNFITWIKNLFK